MSCPDWGRVTALFYATLAIVVIVSASIAGVGTYALLSDTETDDAGTISVVKNNNAAVNFNGACTQADVTPDDPSEWDMTVNLNDGRSVSYDENDYNANPSFKYKTSDEWGNPAPAMANITLDETTYQCN